MANVNERRHLSEAEMWRAVGMVEQGATHRQVGDVFDMHHTVITRAWSRFQRMAHQSDVMVVAEKALHL